MAEQARLNITPTEGIPSGTVPVRLVRLVSGFVAQYELLAEPPFRREGNRELPTNASYRAGDVVYCHDAVEPANGIGQVAVFLADVPEARPAYPVIGRANTRELLKSLDSRHWQREPAAELVDDQTVIVLSLAR